MLISTAYAQAANAGAEASVMSFLPLILIAVMFYLFLLRPQMKRQKEIKAMLAALAKGDEVITAGGLLGKITQIDEQYVLVDIANNSAASIINNDSANTIVKLQKAAITTILPKGTLKSI